MHEPKDQIADVNHFDNKVVVKFEDGKIAFLDGAQVRQENDADSVAMASGALAAGEVPAGPGEE